MPDSEELRETIVAMQRELNLLHTEVAHSSTLLNALDALLSVSGSSNPFCGVFNALLPMFDACRAIVLIQTDDACDAQPCDELECIASNDLTLVGSKWCPDTRINRVLGGRIVTTLGGHNLAACCKFCDVPGMNNQPALYLPLAQGDKRGLLILLREEHKSGFDRSHMALAKKFSLLASHALAAINAHRNEVESQRLKQLTGQLTRSQQALAFRANHDQLTGLPNRSYIQELVNSRLDSKKPEEKLALAFIDLDDFKRVNDVYGHSAGDTLLRGVADRIKSAIRSSDVLGRISGDEFIIILDPYSQKREISGLVRRIQMLLQKPFIIDGIPIKGSASIGIALYPTHGKDYETLRRNADAAMYQAKMAAKGGVAFFSRALGRDMEERFNLEQRVKHALTARQFKCALQGKFDIHSNALRGFEILLRWVDEQGRIYAPGHFLRTASDLNLLDDILLLQVDELLSRMPELDNRFGTDVKYSINIAADQASRPGFIRSVLRPLIAHNQTHKIIFELTEESFLKAEQFQTQVLPILQAAGIGISIDDFGTGYSSLALLSHITANEIKIDRSFITAIQNQPHHQLILRAIESLAAALDVDLVAEGIETPQELQYLREHSTVPSGQGFIFHRPELIDQILAGTPRLLMAG